MIIGVPQEVKNNEKRVALTPPGVTLFTNAGQDVRVQTSAGNGSGFPDSAYAGAGAKIVNTAEEVWSAELVMKVKEPQPEEYTFLREGLILYKGLEEAVKASDAFASGINTHAGAVTQQAVAAAHNMDYKPIADILGKTPVSPH